MGHGDHKVGVTPKLSRVSRALHGAKRRRLIRQKLPRRLTRHVNVITIAIKLSNVYRGSRRVRQHRITNARNIAISDLRGNQ